MTTTWFANSGWDNSAIAQPTVTATEDGYFFTMPDGVGSDQWQGQVHFWTNVPCDPSKNYDFRAVFTSTEDMPRVTVKIQKGDSLGADGDTDDNVYFCLENIRLKLTFPTSSTSKTSPVSTLRTCRYAATTPALPAVPKSPYRSSLFRFTSKPRP